VTHSRSNAPYRLRGKGRVRERHQCSGDALRIGGVRNVAGVEADQPGAADRLLQADSDPERDDRIVATPQQQRRRRDAGRVATQVVLWVGERAP